MTWDAWGMFAGALEQYNDEEETVVVKSEPEPDSEPPPMVWPEEMPLKFDIQLVTVDASSQLLQYLGITQKGDTVTIPVTFGGWGVNSEGCDRCGASKFKDMFCRQCGAPNMVKCPNGDKSCLMCAKHPGWVEELKP